MFKIAIQKVFFITIYQITQSSKEVKKNKKRYTFYFQYISFSEEPKAGLTDKSVIQSVSLIFRILV
nr:MAG TPA: hypothetical protein [Caudoviricetes sp.]